MFVVTPTVTCRGDIAYPISVLIVEIVENVPYVAVTFAAVTFAAVTLIEESVENIPFAAVILIELIELAVKLLVVRLRARDVENDENP